MAISTSDLISSVSNVTLPIIDYNLLVQNDATEVKRLFETCTELGFFYLKLDDQLDPKRIFTLAKQIFELSSDIKMKYIMDGKNGVYFGYKAIGSMFADRKGTPDKIEFWNVSKDEILINDKTEFPDPIINDKTIIKEYMIKSHEIVLVILEILSIKLGLDSKILPNLHRLMQPSGDQLRMTKTTMHPTQNENLLDIVFGAHTDFGSITILFNQLGGLQVLGSNGNWLNVQPLTGHAIVNLGDSMVKLSGGQLKSNIHRIVNMPGLNEIIDRYSVVYFSRPENIILMKSLINNEKEELTEDQILTAQQWIATRVKNYQTVNYKDESTYDMSRGTEGHRETDVSM